MDKHFGSVGIVFTLNIRINNLKFFKECYSFIQKIRTMKTVVNSCFNSTKIADRIMCLESYDYIYEIDGDLVLAV